MVLRNLKYLQSQLLRKAGPVLCFFYLIGICNGLVLEILHETSHMVAPESHHHSFLDHHEVEQTTLEALAGHSHETLQLLKDLLEVQTDDDRDQEQPFHFELDRHFPEKTHLSLCRSQEFDAAPSEKPMPLLCIRALEISTPPPQFS